MTTPDTDLTVEICTQDGSRTEFYQNDRENVARILGLVVTPRLFSQSLLMFASEQGVTCFANRAVDVIRIHTSAPMQLAWPRGLASMEEISREGFDEEVSGWDHDNGELGDAIAIAAAGASHMEIHTTGAWVIFLRFFADESGTIHDQRFSLAHFFDLPVIPFRLKAGGVGFVNPVNISRISMYPGFKGAPASALPAELLRWTSLFARKQDEEAIQKRRITSGGLQTGP